jgi:hypothetical protein
MTKCNKLFRWKKFNGSPLSCWQQDSSDMGWRRHQLLRSELDPKRNLVSITRSKKVGSARFGLLHLPSGYLYLEIRIISYLEILKTGRRKRIGKLYLNWKLFIRFYLKLLTEKNAWQKFRSFVLNEQRFARGRGYEKESFVFIYRIISLADLTQPWVA